MTGRRQVNKYLVRAAMALTLGTLIYTPAGVLGWGLWKRVGAPYGHWTGAPIPWEIGVGLVAGIGAAICWRSVFAALRES